MRLNSSFSGRSQIQVDQFNLLISNLRYFNLIRENPIQFDQILIRSKVQISWSYPLFNSTVYPNSYFPYWGPKCKLSPKNSISFFDERERKLLRIPIIRDNRLPDKTTLFSIFFACLIGLYIQLTVITKTRVPKPILPDF